MSQNNQPTLLVTGASGHLGRRVVELLLESGAGSIVAATRTPDKLADFSQRGVSVRYGSFDDPASLLEAFKGVDRLLLISTDMVDLEGGRLKQHVNAVEAAEQAGVKQVVYTSLMNPGEDSPVRLAADHRGTEAALESSTMGWTVLRENIYTDMLLMSLGRAVQMGKLINAAGDGKTAYITREDCARVFAAVLAASFDGRRTLDITGSEALSQTELAEIATAVTGHPVIYVPVELETVIQGMTSVGVPRPVAEGYASFDTGIAQGKFSQVSNNVEELTGRKPTGVADFLAAHRDAILPAAAH